MIIDAHSHVQDPVHDHIAALDEAGVDRVVLFLSRPHPERATDLAGFRREMSVLDHVIGGEAVPPEAYRAAWRELDAALAAHPDRFIGLGRAGPVGRADRGGGGAGRGRPLPARHR